MRSALEQQSSIAEVLRNRQLALLLDYDGTLTPIVRRPEDAILPESVRELLRRLAGRCTVAVVSGRDRRDVEKMVQIDLLTYAGSHGFDIHGPEVQMEHEEARRVLPDLDRAEAELRDSLTATAGARVERKRFAIAIHYREVEAEEGVRRVAAIVEEVRGRHGALRKLGGKKIFELQPDVPWNKGYAVMFLLESLGLNHPGVAAIYIGDDETDENAFRALESREASFGIRVASPEEASAAAYYLRDCGEVETFLRRLLTSLDPPER
ncbi:MAG: trehalose-phosphatase [Planctomycetes bacterium]|nr:trehalose-phosphatase [Planctomycetota bacterium]